MKKLCDILPYFIKELDSNMNKNEIITHCYIVIKHFLNYNRSDTIVFSNEYLTEEDIVKIKNVVKELKSYKPIQYILSESFFCDLRFFVNEDVLIPRKETEELVNWIIHDNINTHKSYLDIGTGSACIIISLSKKLNGDFEGVDVSKKALDIAKKNCMRHDVNISLNQLNILNDNLSNNYDVIVSNPPYVLNSEKQFLDNNIFFEPDIALFVDDSDPLIYYKKIIKVASKYLKHNGLLYFEINEKFGSDIIDLLKNHGFVNIELKKDINDKHRMVKSVFK